MDCLDPYKQSTGFVVEMALAIVVNSLHQELDKENVSLLVWLNLSWSHHAWIMVMCSLGAGLKNDLGISDGSTCNSLCSLLGHLGWLHHMYSWAAIYTSCQCVFRPNSRFWILYWFINLSKRTAVPQTYLLMHIILQRRPLLFEV